MIIGVVKHQVNKLPDERGFFAEIIRHNDPYFKDSFAQLSHSFMHDGVVKAWHIHKTQTDFWYVASGTIKVALLDLRTDSKTYKELNEYTIGDNGEQIVLKIPPGVAHGLKVLKGPANLIYITSSVYNPEEEGRIAYNNQDINYDWVQGKAITNKNVT